MTQLTQKIIERDLCPRCLHYIDKHIYRDCDSSIATMGTVKDCKFHTDKDWLCDFKEVEDSYGFLGADVPCVLLTDEYAPQESGEKRNDE